MLGKEAIFITATIILLGIVETSTTKIRMPPATPLNPSAEDYLEKPLLGHAFSSESELNSYLQGLESRRKIEKGRYGVVHLYCDKERRKYAVKEIARGNIKIESMVKKESNLLKQLKGPFTIELYWTRKSDYSFYLIMEYAESGDLFNYINRYRGSIEELGEKYDFPEEITRIIAAEIVVAMEDIHSKDYIHGDLKMENIVIGSDGHIKLIDFQFANKIGTDPVEMFSGTPGYMALELFKKSLSSKESDYFAFGVILYMMLIGKPAFPRAIRYYERNVDDAHKYMRIAQPAFLGELNSTAHDIVSKLLMKNVEERRKSIGILMNHLFFVGIEWGDIRARRHPTPFKPIEELLGSRKKMPNPKTGCALV